MKNIKAKAPTLLGIEKETRIFHLRAAVSRSGPSGIVNLDSKLKD